MALNTDHVQSNFVRKVHFLKKKQSKQLDVELSHLQMEHKHAISNIQRQRKMFLDKYAQHIFTPLLMSNYDGEEDAFPDDFEDYPPSLFPMTNLNNAQNIFSPRSRKNSLSGNGINSVSNYKVKHSLTRQHTVTFPLQMLELNKMGIDFNKLKKKRLSTCSDILPLTGSRRPSLSSSLLQKFPRLAQQDAYQGILSGQKSTSSGGQDSRFKRLSIYSTMTEFPDIKQSTTPRTLGITRTKSFHTRAPERTSDPLPLRSHSMDIGRQNLLSSMNNFTTIRNTRMNAERNPLYTSDLQNGMTLTERIERFKEEFLSPAEEKAREDKLRATKRFKRLRSVVKVVFRKPDGRPLTPVDEESDDLADVKHRAVQYYDPVWESLQDCRYLRLPLRVEGDK